MLKSRQIVHEKREFDTVCFETFAHPACVRRGYASDMYLTRVWRLIINLEVQRLIPGSIKKKPRCII